MEKPDYPLRFQPIFKERIWGSKAEQFRVRLKAWDGIAPACWAECWALSDRAEDNSRIANGALTGRTLREAIEAFPEILLGPGAVSEQRFPLLIKWIQTGQACSLQVHPPDAYASLNHAGELGKNELWYVVEAVENAELRVGFREKQTAQSVREAIREKRLENDLNPVAVKAGDAFFLPAGRVHGIGPGILLAEIQDNSDLTFRVYDYGRRDEQGRERELQVDPALAVIDFLDTSNGRVRDQEWKSEDQIRRTLLGNAHFKVESITCASSWKGPAQSGFQILMVTRGEGILAWAKGAEPLEPGEVFLLPAGFSDWRLEPKQAGLGLLRSWKT